MDKEVAKARLRAATEVAPNGCFTFTGYRNQYGYGNIIVQGVKWAAHRLAYTLYRRPIPEGMFVCHSCDNPSCVNPAHLWCGSHQDNMADAKAKKRIARANRTHCPRGHSFAEYGRIYGNQKYRSCAACELAKDRISAGWPSDLAYSMPAGRPGDRPPEAGPPQPMRRTGQSNRDKTHCKRGHEFTPENTYIFPSNGRRGCRRCAVLRHKRLGSTTGEKP